MPKVPALLTVGNPKLAKSFNSWYLTTGLHLAPAHEAGYNTCPLHTPECAATCLHFAGRGAMRKVQAARIRRTRMFFEDRAAFLAQLRAELKDAQAQATAMSFDLAVRLNLTSDIRWELFQIPQEFPTVQFYDYTKLTHRKAMPSNYHITYSYSGHNLRQCLDYLAAGTNVAVPFLKVPTEWQGYKVIDGDEHDLRFLDETPRVIGLKAKGRLRHDAESLFLGDNVA